MIFTNIIGIISNHASKLFDIIVHSELENNWNLSIKTKHTNTFFSLLLLPLF